MKKLTSIFLFLSLVITFFYMSSTRAEVYKWVDSTGELHYSDQPPTDQNKAEIIKIKVQKPSGDNKTPNTLEDNSKVDQAVKNKLKDYKEIREHNSTENIEENLKKLKALPDIDTQKSPSTVKTTETNKDNTEGSKGDASKSGEQPNMQPAASTNASQPAQQSEPAKETPSAEENQPTDENSTTDETSDKTSHLNNKNCSIALQNLKNLKDNKIILNKQNRKLIHLSDAEHAKKMKQTKKNIEKFC